MRTRRPIQKSSQNQHTHRRETVTEVSPHARVTNNGVTLIYSYPGTAVGSELYVNQATGETVVLYHALLEFIVDGRFLCFRPLNGNIRPEHSDPWLYVELKNVSSMYDVRRPFLVGPLIESGDLVFGQGAWGQVPTYADADPPSSQRRSNR